MILGQLIRLLTAMGLLLLSGCQHEDAWPGERSDRIVVLMPASIGKLDPRLIRDGNTSKVARLIYRGLFRVREHDLRPVPDLASGLRYESPTRACITLKEDIEFHNARPVLAGDVAYTFESAMDPALRSPIGGLFRDRLHSIDLPDGPDGRILCVNLKAEVATLRTDLVLGIIPRNTAANSDKIIPGTGAFKLHRRDGDRGVILKRTQSSPELPDFIVFRTLPDENTRLLAILSGDADLVVNGFSPSVLSVLETDDKVNVTRHPSVTVTYLTMNSTRAPLHEARVRRAISHAIDRTWITANRFGGAARLANGMLPEGHWARDPDIPPAPFAPETARALLAENASNDAPPIQLELLVSNDRLRQLIGRDIKRYLEKIGIEVRIRSLELGTFLAAVRSGAYELAILQLPEPIEPDMMRWMFYSLATPLEQVADAPTPLLRQQRRHLEPGLESLISGDNAACRFWALNRIFEANLTMAQDKIKPIPRQGGGNRSFWADPELDCWLDSARRQNDGAARKDLYAKIQARIARDVPVLFLWHEDNVAVFGASVSGVELSLRPGLDFLPEVSNTITRNESSSRGELQPQLTHVP